MGEEINFIKVDIRIKLKNKKTFEHIIDLKYRMFFFEIDENFKTNLCFLVEISNRMTKILNNLILEN